jgi:hypothetical protein
MIKSLYQTQARPQPKVRHHPIDEHSKHGAARRDYYANNLANVDSRAVDSLNPTETVPAHRRFPGLAN